MIKRKQKDQGAREIVRLWGDMDVVDATRDLRIFVRHEDMANAKPKSPDMCVFANACKRTFGTTKVLFFRRVAYVELPDESGVKHVERFTLGPGVRELIEKFDREETRVFPEGGFLLKSPPYSKTLQGGIDRNERKRELREIRKRKASLINGKTDRSRRAPYGSPSMVVDLSVRNGTGMVHFNPLNTAKSE